MPPGRGVKMESSAGQAGKSQCLQKLASGSPARATHAEMVVVGNFSIACLYPPTGRRANLAHSEAVCCKRFLLGFSTVDLFRELS